MTMPINSSSNNSNVNNNTNTNNHNDINTNTNANTNTDAIINNTNNRPWYKAAISSPKDIVIIVDSSGSMGVASLATAKEAIKTVIQMLGLNDHVVSAPRGVQRAGPAGTSAMFTFLLAAVHGVFVCVRAAGDVLACLLVFL